ncbi:MAG: LysM peptidoglycan-binding domain-containing protein [Thermodesulfobacteriota bacterium]
MKDESELEMDEGWPESRAYSPKRRGGESGSGRYLRILVVIFLVLIFAGGILYFLSRSPSGGDTAPVQSKEIALEQRIARLEKRIAELQRKIGTQEPDPALLNRIDALSQKVEALEKGRQPVTEVKVKPSAPPKPAPLPDKKYHTVQKGDTLYKISKRYGISVEELRKLNHLSADQALRSGQKLLVSPGHE